MPALPQRVVLTGRAERRLVEATRLAFEANRAAVTTDAPTQQEGAGRSPDAPDVCVCFARPGASRPLGDVDQVDWERDLERDLLAPMRLAMATARGMAAGSGGAIVFVGAADAFHAYPGRSSASVAMGGLLGLTRSMAVELARRAIRVNLVVSGPLGTEDGDPPAGAEESLVERTLLRSPAHRFARPSEVAAAIRFVAGADADFMTGQTLRVDGGWSSLNQAPEGMRFP